MVDAGKIDSLGRGGGKRVEESRNEPWRIEISEKNLECREKEKETERERENEKWRRRITPSLTNLRRI